LQNSRPSGPFPVHAMPFNFCRPKEASPQPPSSPPTSSFFRNLVVMCSSFCPVTETFLGSGCCRSFLQKPCGLLTFPSLPSHAAGPEILSVQDRIPSRLTQGFPLPGGLLLFFSPFLQSLHASQDRSWPISRARSARTQSRSVRVPPNLLRFTVSLLSLFRKPQAVSQTLQLFGPCFPRPPPGLALFLQFRPSFWRTGLARLGPHHQPGNLNFRSDLFSNL